MRHSAIESFYLNDPERALLHGEAIAIGMLCESYLSAQKEFISSDDLAAIEQYINQLYPTLTILSEEISSVAQLTTQDKKNEDGKIMCTLLVQPGQAIYNQPITITEVEDALKWYQGLS